MRFDKQTVAFLENTLICFLDEDKMRWQIPLSYLPGKHAVGVGSYLA